MACESGLACISSSGCVEPLASGAIGSLMTIGADGNPTWGTQDDVEDLGFHPAAAMQGTTATTLVTNAFTPIPTPNRVHESVAGMVTAGVLVAPVSGYYNVSGYVDVTGIVGDRFGVRLVHSTFDSKEIHAGQIAFTVQRTRMSFNEPGMFMFVGDTISLEGFSSATPALPGDRPEVRRARLAIVLVDQQ